MGAKKGRKKEEEEEEPDYINIHYIDGSWFFNEPDLRLCVCLLHRDRDRSAFFLALAASRFFVFFFFFFLFSPLLRPPSVIILPLFLSPHSVPRSLYKYSPPSLPTPRLLYTDCYTRRVCVYRRGRRRDIFISSYLIYLS